MPRPLRPIHQSGFTIIEALFAVAVLALVVGGLTQAVVSGQALTYNALHESRAVALAEALMEEIRARPTADPDGDTALGPDVGETERGAFDAVDDFHGLAEDGTDRLLDSAGTAYPETFQMFERRVSVGRETVDAGLFGSRAVMRVEVRVSEPSGRAWIIEKVLAEETP